jgi:hypothetical protein
VQIRKLKLGFGRVVYSPKVETIPASVVTEGNVTTHTPENPGQPSYFAATFQISGDVEHDGVELFNVFSLDVPVVGGSGRSPYAEIESEAARQLAPILRLFAEELEKQVAETESGPSSDQPD